MKSEHRIDLHIIAGPQGRRDFLLTEDSSYVGRSDQDRHWTPHVDLLPDHRISRKHARVFFESGSWWIKDLGSSHGTMVGGKRIGEQSGPAELVPGIEVVTGDTRWTITPTRLSRLTLGDLDLEFRATPAINYALYQCGIPVVYDLMLSNTGSEAHPGVRVSFSIPGYSNPWHKDFGRLQPGASAELNEVPLALHYEVLEGLESRTKAQLELRIDGEVVFGRDISIAGFYEWPFDIAFRKSLACFVQPAHPIIQDIVAEARSHLERGGYPGSFTQLVRGDVEDKAERCLTALYECLRSGYSIRYVRQAPSYEHDSQVIRPPHRVILDSEARAGQGTCIDLALLMAACVESLHLQPLVVITGVEGGGYHALVGCWADVTERAEPIITDSLRLQKALDTGKLIVLDPTGFTDRFAAERGGRLSRVEAGSIARDQLTSGGFTFALDVAAARQTVVPLQFPMGPGVLSALRRAEELARDTGSAKLETKHLLLGLFLEGGADVRKVVRGAGGALASVETLGGSMRPVREAERCVPRPTINYRRCLEDARIVAGDSGVSFVEERHLLYAVLLSQSDSVDEILGGLGTDRERARTAFEESFAWAGKVVETYFEPGRRASKRPQRKVQSAKRKTQSAKRKTDSTEAQAPDSTHRE